MTMVYLRHFYKNIVLKEHRNIVENFTPELVLYYKETISHNFMHCWL